MGEESETTKTPEPAQRVSSYFFLIIFIVLIISFGALYVAVTSFHVEGSLQSNILPIVFLVIGFIGVSFSTYVLLHTRHRVLQLSLELPPVMTTITCQKCDFRNQRVFERGDYVFKDAGPCPKCNNKLLISAIYREVKEKPKKEIF
jgi:hypothetical protein